MIPRSTHHCSTPTEELYSACAIPQGHAREVARAGRRYPLRVDLTANGRWHFYAEGVYAAK
jgi:hypothetical protein